MKCHNLDSDHANKTISFKLYESSIIEQTSGQWTLINSAKRSSSLSDTVYFGLANQGTGEKMHKN